MTRIMRGHQTLIRLCKYRYNLLPPKEMKIRLQSFSLTFFLLSSLIAFSQNLKVVAKVVDDGGDIAFRMDVENLGEEEVTFYDFSNSKGYSSVYFEGLGGLASKRVFTRKKKIWPRNVLMLAHLKPGKFISTKVEVPETIINSFTGDFSVRLVFSPQYEGENRTRFAEGIWTSNWMEITGKKVENKPFSFEGL